MFPLCFFFFCFCSCYPVLFSCYPVFLNLVFSLHQIVIPDDERVPFVTPLVPATKRNEEYALRALVGKVISNNILNKKVVRTIMFQTWNDYKDLYITDMGDNKFLFTFPSVRDTQTVLQRAHWFVINQVLSLKRWEAGLAFAYINFDFVPFWVQIHGLA